MPIVSSRQTGVAIISVGLRHSRLSHQGTRFATPCGDRPLRCRFDSRDRNSRDVMRLSRAGISCETIPLLASRSQGQQVPGPGQSSMRHTIVSSRQTGVAIISVGLRHSRLSHQGTRFATPCRDRPLRCRFDSRDRNSRDVMRLSRAGISCETIPLLTFRSCKYIPPIFTIVWAYNTWRAARPEKFVGFGWRDLRAISGASVVAREE